MLDLGDWLRYRARSAPEAFAVGDDSEELTYAALLERVDAARKTLAAEGLGEGALVGCRLPSSVHAVVSLYAIWQLGAIAVPLAGHSEGGNLDFEICEPLPIDAGSNDDAADGLARYDHGAGRVASRIRTSGSQGSATEVDLTHANHLWSAIGSSANLGSSPSDRWLCCLPLHHVSGLAQIHRALLAGGGVVLQDGFDAEPVARSLGSAETNMTSLVATQLRRLLEVDADLGKARAILVGGGPVPEALLDRALERGAAVLRTYGLTEASSQVATVPPHRPREAGESCGPPLPTARVRIVEGEIEIQGPTVAAACASPDGWLRTGDLGDLDDQGNLSVAGRSDDVIVTGGENVSPDEVESSLAEHPAVVEAVVFGLPDEEWQRSVTAALVIADGEEMPSDDELRAHCARSLVGFKIPKKFVELESVPRSEAGKPLRRLVAERFGGDGR